MNVTWLVLIDGTPHSSKEHLTFEAAMEEAERLLALRDNAGRGAKIFEAVAYGQRKLEPIVWEMGPLYEVRSSPELGQQ